jgi:hypothetical protein
MEVDESEPMVDRYKCKEEYSKILECLKESKDKITKCDVKFI